MIVIESAKAYYNVAMGGDDRNCQKCLLVQLVVGEINVLLDSIMYRNPHIQGRRFVSWAYNFRCLFEIVRTSAMF
jgi:hypothetical protein